MFLHLEGQAKEPAPYAGVSANLLKWLAEQWRYDVVIGTSL